MLEGTNYRLVSANISRLISHPFLSFSSSSKDGCNNHFSSSLSRLCRSAKMGMGSLELGLVSADEGREVLETARFCREALQVFGWRLERKFGYVKRSKDQTDWFIRCYSTTCHAIPPSTGQGLRYLTPNSFLPLL